MALNTDKNNFIHFYTNKVTRPLRNNRLAWHEKEYKCTCTLGRNRADNPLLFGISLLSVSGSCSRIWFPPLINTTVKFPVSSHSDSRKKSVGFFVFVSKSVYWCGLWHLTDNSILFDHILHISFLNGNFQICMRFMKEEEQVSVSFFLLYLTGYLFICLIWLAVGSGMFECFFLIFLLLTFILWTGNVFNN